MNATISFVILILLIALAPAAGFPSELVTQRSNDLIEGVGIRAHSGLGCMADEAGYYSIEFSMENYDDNVSKVLSFLNDGFSPDCNRDAVFINEPITNKTVQRFAILAEAITRFSDDPLLVLNSPGGSVYAAMQLGDIVADNFLSATIYTSSSCNSACVFVYAAARERVPLLPGSNQLGIHRAYDSHLSTEQMTYSQYSQRIEELTPVLKNYLAKFGVSPALVDAMNVVPSNEIRYLTDDEASDFGLGKENVAFEEFDRAQTLQICGESYVDLQRQFLRAQNLCIERTVNWKDKYGCYGETTSIFPDFEQRRESCENKKLTARRSNLPWFNR
jgi:hypothetical protein